MKATSNLLERAGLKGQKKQLHSVFSISIRFVSMELPPAPVRSFCTTKGAPYNGAVIPSACCLSLEQHCEELELNLVTFCQNKCSGVTWGDKRACGLTFCILWLVGPLLPTQSLLVLLLAVFII